MPVACGLNGLGGNAALMALLMEASVLAPPKKRKILRLIVVAVAIGVVNSEAPGYAAAMSGFPNSPVKALAKALEIWPA